MSAIFITGTDTGVGKTLVGCGLAAALTAHGKTVGILKPAETGCPVRDGLLYPEDAMRLAAFAHTTLSVDSLCPYRFAPPVAPSVAAEQAGVTIDPHHLVAVFRQIVSSHDVTIVEGAGGLLVPLTGRYTFADLARDLAVPLLVVVGSKLGALNHALLTLRYAELLSLPLAGYILNHPTPATDLAIQTNARTLADLTDVPCRGMIPFVSLTGDLTPDRHTLCSLFSQEVDLTSLLG
jgi:dethiobiotin synthetase